LKNLHLWAPTFKQFLQNIQTQSSLQLSYILIRIISLIKWKINYRWQDNILPYGHQNFKLPKKSI
jgi:hypothetical protein